MLNFIKPGVDVKGMFNKACKGLRRWYEAENQFPAFPGLRSLVAR